MNKEYILLARAKGAGEMTILLRHVLPNIRGTLLTVTALALDLHARRRVLTETVFSWPGIGRYLTTALLRRGYHGDHGRHAADRREFCADQ